jgi:hypothetical protein
MKTKRQARRHRHLLKKQLRELDAIAKKQINNNYNLAASSWGGNRCPGCGITIRPHYLLNADISCTWADENGRWAGHISAYKLPCKNVKKCPGERNWC